MRAEPGRNARSYSGHYMQAGKQAEHLVRDWLLEKPSIASVEDLRDDPNFRRDDIDFCVHLRNGKSVLVEVKSDYYLGESGNVLFELNRVYHDDTQVRIGWSARTGADWVIYYAPQIHEVWQIKPANLQEAFHQYLREAGSSARIIAVPTDHRVTTINVLIPEQYVKHIHKEKLGETP